MKTKDLVESIFAEADVSFNGTRPWDIKVSNPHFYNKVAGGGSLGFGESYMAGDWDSPRLDELITRLFKMGIQRRKLSWAHLAGGIKGSLFNLQTTTRAWEVGKRHYDIGNSLYEKMLDKRMIYSCGYWKNTQTLDEAQEAKLDLICRKLGIKPGMRVLDIGCGWGGTAEYVATKYGATVVGITISKEQAELARRRCQGLPVEIKLTDYRSLEGKFDRIISVGMLEHVGYKNYKTFFKTVRRLLADDGLALIHTIGSNFTRHTTDPWIDKYIFPNSMLPSAAQLAAAIEPNFVIEDWHNFGADYDRTLMAWYKNLRSRNDVEQYKDEQFKRMWEYYLLACAASFRARYNQLWQIVLSPRGVDGGYESLR